MSKKPDDAARIAGLASILKSSNQPKAASPSPAPPAEPVVAELAAPSATPQKKQKLGKYRDPAFHNFGVYLRKETHKQVKRRLEDIESDQDVSELVQSLLEQWLASR